MQDTQIKYIIALWFENNLLNQKEKGNIIVIEVKTKTCDRFHVFVLFLCQYMYDYESMSFDERNNTIVLDGHLVTVFRTYYAGK